MKLPIAFWIFAFALGMMSAAFGQAPSPGLPANSTSPVGGLALPGTTTGAKPEGQPNETNTDESDDTLYRGKTSESENPMMRDEGRLHFKTRPKEKVQEVDSLKKLKSSGVDPRFQSNLLFSGASSIENLGARPNETRSAEDEGDPRFKTKHLVFTADKKDEPKQAQSNSTPSPTPSPTASPPAKNSPKE
jgi:hypothetical protein